MLKKSILIIFILSIYGCNYEQTTSKKPKLVIGLVVDQMRYDYLTRFYNRYGDGGFKRLIKKGFLLENAHYNYIPTYTAVGHTSIFTGTTPSNHGIISNNWYDKLLKKSIYCVDDNSYSTVGSNGNDGSKSPKRLQVTTIADQLHLSQNSKGKTIGIAIKDRGAILPIGHSGNGAYWYKGKNDGNWISSTYYMDELPKWVIDFNNERKANSYLKSQWNTLYDIKSYSNSFNDDNIFERKFVGEKSPTFPHDISKLRMINGNYDIIKSTPFGNSFTADFAKAAILGENLGKNEHTDFLTVSFSSTDYIGHQFGPQSIEIEDTYLRLDKDLEDFLQFLDKEVGKNNYTLFLTADHGAVHVPSYLQSLKIKAHYLNHMDLKEHILTLAKKYFKSTEIIENISNFQVFLNKDKIESLGFTKDEVTNKLVEELIYYKDLYKVVSAKTLQTTSFNNGVLQSLQNGYNQKYSGDICMIPYPATLGGGRTGTSHGSGYNYDTHIPVLFYGKGIQKGTSKKRYNITDIAPTISNLLEIEAPNASTGKIIDEAIQ